MKPPGKSPPNWQRADEFITKGDVEGLANPLSVVHGYTQILQRRIRGGKDLDDEELLRVLDLIEEASQLLTTRLIALRAGLRLPDDPHDSEDAG